MSRYEAFRLLFEPINGWSCEECCRDAYNRFEKVQKEKRNSQQDFKATMAAYRDSLPIP